MTESLIELRLPDDIDFAEFLDSWRRDRPPWLADADLVTHMSIVDTHASQFIGYVQRHGMTSLIARSDASEALVGPTTPQLEIKRHFHDYLRQLNISDELIVVDPYFLCLSDAEVRAYSKTVIEYMEPILNTLKTLRVVHDKVRSESAKNAFLGHLRSRCPTLSITTRCTKTFHDRFWVNPRTSSGFITGTSFNGLGKKYAVIERLTTTDVAEIARVVDGLFS